MTLLPAVLFTPLTKAENVPGQTVLDARDNRKEPLCQPVTHLPHHIILIGRFYSLGNKLELQCL